LLGGLILLKFGSSTLIDSLLGVCIAIIKTRDLFDHFRYDGNRGFMFAFLVGRRRWRSLLPVGRRRYCFCLFLLLFLNYYCVYIFRWQLGVFYAILFWYILIFGLLQGRIFAFYWYRLCYIFDNMSCWFIMLYCFILFLLRSLYRWFLNPRTLFFDLIVRVGWFWFLF
jgi:hypothetical protein